MKHLPSSLLLACFIIVSASSCKARKSGTTPEEAAALAKSRQQQHAAKCESPFDLSTTPDGWTEVTAKDLITGAEGTYVLARALVYKASPEKKAMLTETIVLSEVGGGALSDDEFYQNVICSNQLGEARPVQIDIRPPSKISRKDGKYSEQLKVEFRANGESVRALERIGSFLSDVDGINTEFLARTGVTQTIKIYKISDVDFELRLDRQKTSPAGTAQTIAAFRYRLKL